MKKQLWNLALIVATTGLFFAACQKNDGETATELELLVSSTDLAQIEDASEQADFDADQAVEDRGPNPASGGGCPTITFLNQQGTWPNTITVDFGTDGCLRPNGRILKGKIIIDQSAAMTEVGATRKHTLVGFFVNDLKVEGTATAIFTSLNAAGQPIFDRTASKTLTWPDGKSATWTATHQAVMTFGFSTQVVADNVWAITGASEGTNRNGKAFLSTITLPLEKRGDCRWIVAGEREVTAGGKTRTLNFGAGDCDDLATLTRANGTTAEIKLRK